MHLDLSDDPELVAALSSLAEAEGVPAAEVVRRAVLDRSARADALGASAGRMVAEWRDVLDRLARE